jgi:hypothetical protein
MPRDEEGFYYEAADPGHSPVPAYYDNEDVGDDITPDFDPFDAQDEQDAYYEEND